jgi:peptidylprolyl isomerase
MHLDMLTLTRRTSILVTVLVVALSACNGNSANGEDGAADGSTTATTATQDSTSTTTQSQETTGEGAQDGDIVSVHYIGTLDDGTVFDSSYEGDPLEFEVGTDQVIKGFDDAVHGMVVGEKKTVRIPPEDAYGPVDQELIFQVPIEQAPDNVAVGDEVLIDGVVYGRVTAIADTEVTIDTNNRFAGQALTFEIELISING